MLSNLRNTLLKCTAAVLLCTTYGQAIALEPSKAATNAEVFFIEPKNGAEITGPVTIKFGIKNMTVIPAGVQHPYSGHHHLLIDVDKLPDLTSPIPADANHRHFGKGQTEVTLELEPGEHTLQLLLGDHFHIPHDKPVLSEKITITVKAKPAAAAK